MDNSYPLHNSEMDYGKNLYADSGVCGEWEESITAITEELRRYQNNSESHFSLISENLQRHYVSAKDIFSKAYSITDLFSSHEYLRQVDNLQGIMKSIQAYLEKVKNKFNYSEKTLGDIHKLLFSVNDRVASFRKIVKHLKIHAMAVRIESARLATNDKGFNNLAANINDLANLITVYSDQFRSKSSLFNSVIKEAGKQINELEEYQDRYTNEIFLKIKSSLDSLNHKHEIRTGKLVFISSEIEKVQNEISNLVTAVQFHDITRQQIDHVIKVLADTKNHLVSNQDKNFIKSLTISSRSLTIQHAQLESSMMQVSGAISTITGNFEQLTDNVEKISGEISDLMENDEKGSYFLNSIEKDLNEVISGLIKNLEVDLKFTDSVENVIGIIMELSEFVVNISNIGAEVELISLNAIIKAAHTGTEGAALGVLAESIQRLSTETKSLTASITSELTSIKDISGKMQSDKLLITEDEKECENLSVGVKNTFKSLQGSLSSAMSDLEMIRKMTDKIKKDINLTIGANHNFDHEEDRLKSALKTIASMRTIEGASELSEEEMNTELIKLSEGYTMQSQREIFDRLTTSGEEEILPGSESEFGSNIELF